MRFLPHEYNSLLELAESMGLQVEQFRSVKQKGKMHIYFAQYPEPFKFFRFSETKLAAGKWMEKELYRIYPNGKAKVVEDWETVRGAMEEWLRGLAATGREG